MRYVYYAPYYGLEHLMLLKRGWKELHCIYIEDQVFIKMVSPEESIYA